MGAGISNNQGRGRRRRPTLMAEINVTPFVDVMLVLELFREEAAQAVARVETALAEGDAGVLWRAAHKLKGTAAELGAEALREYWGRLEQCGRSGDLEKSAELFLAAKAELEQIRGVLDAAPFNAAEIPA